MDKEGAILAIVCSVFILGVCIGGYLRSIDFEKKAVEANVAYYDSKTKEFKFIDVKDK